MATRHLTFDEARASIACADCGAPSARCSNCGEGAEAHARIAGVIRCKDDVCSDAVTPDGEFYRAERYVVGYEPGMGHCLAELCPTCERIREGMADRTAAARARARGEDC